MATGFADGSLTIRPATPEDEGIIEDLRSAVGWSTADTGLGSMARGRSILYVVEDDKRIAASGALVLTAEDAELADGSATGLISNLIVHPDFQRRGIGTKLLHFLEEEASERGYRRVTIGVDASNVAAKRLYEREGYRPLKDKLELWGPVNYLVKLLEGTAQE